MNRTPKIAVIGCGYWGRNLVRNFEGLGTVAMVVDDTDRGRQLAHELAPAAEIAHTLDAVLARRDITAVAVATPAVTHFDFGRRILEAGKDLFVEKPMALSLADGCRLVELANEHQRILHVGHVLEYHPAVDRLREWLQQGRLGRLCWMQSHRLNFGRVRTEEDALWNVAPHDFALMIRLVGALPREVSCFASHPLGTPRADYAIAMLRFAGGIDAHVFAGWLHPTKEQRLVLIGETGAAIFDDAAPLDRKLSFHDQRVELVNGVPVMHRNPPLAEVLPAQEPLRIECEAFLAAVTTRQPPLTDGLSGLRVLAVLEACRTSMSEGGAIVPVPELRGA